MSAARSCSPGAGASGALLEAAGARIARVLVDAAGDGSFEVAATVAWSELGLPSSQALADGDGDGMHDSWERANGLDPARAGDAGEDSDGDGFANRVEYLAGSTPNLASSAPKGVAALTTTVRVATSAIADVDDDAAYELRVANAGPDAATALRARFAIAGATPSGLREGDGWECVRDSTHVTCTLPRLAAGAVSTLHFGVRTPVTPGQARFAGLVAAETVDLDRADNAFDLTQQVRGFSPVLEATLARAASFVDIDPSGRRLFGANENTPVDPAGSNLFVVETATPTLARDLGRSVSPSAIAAALDGQSAYVAASDGFVQVDGSDGRVLRLFGRPPGRMRDDRLTTFRPLTIPGRPDLLLVRVEGDTSDPQERLVLFRDGTPLPDTLVLSALDVRGLAWDAERNRGLVLRNITSNQVANLEAFTLGSTGVLAAGTLLRAVVTGELTVDGRYAATSGGALIDLATNTLVINDAQQQGVAVLDGARQRLYRFARQGRFDIHDARDGRWLYSTRLGVDVVPGPRIDGNLFVLNRRTQIDFLRLPLAGF